MLKRMMVMLGLLCAFISAPALALTLDEAKAQGLVGEQVDGYVAAMNPSPSPEVAALVQSTNEGRRRVYADIAQRNGISVEEVGVLSAEKLREQAAPGHFIQLPSGEWQRK